MLRVVMVLSFISAAMAISCDKARLKCAFRTGCGNALHAYVVHCSAILHESPQDQCPEECQHALIALTSSDEGKDLMTCECDHEMCNDTKERIEICRPQVMRAVKNDTRVSCDVAQWICAADATCAKALEYYHSYCQSMFVGRRCSFRCRNSIAILKKQEKAAKLDSCWCNGKEEYDCISIRRNMDRLCFNKTIIDETHYYIGDEDNDVLKTTVKDIDTNMISPDGSSSLRHDSHAQRIILLLVALLISAVSTPRWTFS